MKKYFTVVSILVLTLVLWCGTALSAEQTPLAYTQLTDGYWQIWLTRSSGQAQQVTHSKNDKRSPAWIDANRALVYRTANGKLWRVDIEQQEERPWLGELGVMAYPAWNQATQRLAFTRYESHMKDESEIWTVSATGTDLRQLTNAPGLQYCPAWSADGAALAFTSSRQTSHELWLINSDGSGLRQLTTQEGGYDLRPAWSPDGREIAFTSNRSGNYDIWLINIDASGLRPLTTEQGLDSSPAFSPDGAQVAFVSDRSGSEAIWILDRASGACRRLNNAVSAQHDPAWQWPAREQ